MTGRENMIPEEKRAEYRMDMIIGNLLRLGVMIAGVVVLLGGIYYLIRYGLNTPNYQSFHGEPAALKTVSGIIKDAALLNSRAIIQFGFLILIATPVARVVFSIFAFGRQRDWIYVAVTLFVLATLIFSMSGGHL